MVNKSCQLPIDGACSGAGDFVCLIDPSGREMGGMTELCRVKAVSFVFGPLLAAILFLSGPAAALTASDPVTCQRLETQLEAPDSGVDEHALKETLKLQRIELAKVRGQAAAMNCLSDNGKGKSNSSFSCQSVQDAISTMEENISYYSGLSRHGNEKPIDRDRILAALKKNNCGSGDQPLEEANQQDGVIIYGQDPIETGSVIQFDDNTLEGAAQEETGSISNILVNLPESIAMSDIRGTEGNYITMCVRSCDGYYFPISYSSGLPNFGSDSDQCHSRCPNSETEIYYYQVPEQESRNMISLSGKKYRDQPFAFKYRSETPGANPSCSCKGAAGEFSVIGGSESENDFALLTGPEGEKAIAASLAARNKRNDDFAAKVRAAIDGEEDTATPPQLVEDSNVHRRQDGGIRVVGPKFFPDPKEGAILRSPGPNPDQ
jgi:hypothetical protein